MIGENCVEGEWTGTEKWKKQKRVGETTGSMTHNNKNNEAREIEVNYCECLIEETRGGEQRQHVIGFILSSK
jgi:hypothetical protein